MRTAGPKIASGTDLLYVQMQPYDSAEPGAWLSQTTGKPWVADLLDPWALDEMMIYPSALHRRRELARMGAALSTAAAIVMNTPESVDRVRQTFPALRGVPIYSISNGFDPADFAGNPAPRDDGKFRIVHTGYLHTDLGLQMRRRRLVRRVVGGEVRGVDIYTRSHVYLMQAIEQLIATEPSLAQKIELHLAGVLSDRDRELAEASPVAILHGYLDHPQTVALQRSADLLFLPMHDLPPGTRTTIIPGKTWEYLASRRPILAAVPDGDARETLAAAGSATLVRPTDVDGMAAAIASLIERGADGIVEPFPAVVDRYAYPRLTADLAAVFDAVLRSQRDRTGAHVAAASRAG